MAFSGGVDSRFLAAGAKYLGFDFIAWTFSGPHITAFETQFAEHWCRKNEITQKTVFWDPLLNADIEKNDELRCYFCKRDLLERIDSSFRILLDGSNTDDFLSSRPGIAALKEFDVFSPLKMAGIDKSMLRRLGRHIGLDNYCQPSRSCLMTRFEKKMKITRSMLAAISACEQKFLTAGLRDFRVRVFPNHARIIIQKQEKTIFERLCPEIESFAVSTLNLPTEIFFTRTVSGFSV
ncbi:MAG: PP-loop family protein [Thermodesulfobacteriota bacterium]